MPLSSDLEPSKCPRSLVARGSIARGEFEAIFVAFTALVFGAIGASQAGAFAPNYAKAKLSADRIFFLLDRVPVI